MAGAPQHACAARSPARVTIRATAGTALEFPNKAWLRRAGAKKRFLWEIKRLRNMREDLWNSIYRPLAVFACNAVDS